MMRVRLIEIDEYEDVPDVETYINSELEVLTQNGRFVNYCRMLRLGDRPVFYVVHTPMRRRD